MNAPKPPPAPTVGSQLQGSNTPFGSVSFSPNAAGGYDANVSASPALQPAVERNLQAYGSQGPANFDPSAAVDKAVGMENKYMKPFFDQQQSNLDAKLQNMGFSMGSQGYNNAQRELQNNQNNWVGGNVAQFEPLAFQQEMQNYFAPLQAAESAFNPQLINPISNQVAPAVQTQTAANQYNYGQQMQNYSAMMGGLFSIPSAVAGGWAKAGFPGMPGMPGMMPGSPVGI